MHVPRVGAVRVCRSAGDVLGNLHLTSWVLAQLSRAFYAALTLGVLAASPGAVVNAATTLDAVKARGHVVCGVRADVVGFSQVDARGRWSGLEVDFCRALAAAALGSKDAIEFWAVSDSERYRLLSRGEIDVLAGGADFTLSRDTELGVRFVDTLFHDGTMFMVRRSQNIFSALELSGASVCVLEGARGKAEVAEFFEMRGMRYQPVASSSWTDVVNAYLSGSCNAIAGEMSILAAARMKFPVPQEHAILPDSISKEPIGPAVRQGDERWFSIVRWTLMALIRAEELGVTSKNAEAKLSSTRPSVRRLLGVNFNFGQAMGLNADWAYQAILQVGNYGELFERNLGSRSPLRLERGLNKLWAEGGLMYAMPLR